MSSTLYDKDLAGQWSGTLHVQGTQLRIVFRIDKTNNQYTATMDSPDQNTSGTKVTVTNFNYPNVKLEIPSIGAVYEGTLADKDITGKWVQSGTALFLVLVKNADAPKKGN